MNRIIIVLMAAFCLFSLAGCTTDEGRSDITGTVTIDGKPLAGGQINFIPLNPPQGIGVVTGNAEITNGKYFITGKLGLLPGDYKVSVMAQRMIDKKTGEDITGTGDKEAVGTYDIVNLVPPKYGDRSEVVFKLETKGKTTFDLDMKKE